MSVRPTTRSGYRESARPHRWRQRIPYEHEGVSGERKFRRSRTPMRMAGDKSPLSFTSGYAASPQGVGYADRDANLFQVFEDNPQVFPEDWGPVEGYF